MMPGMLLGGCFAAVLWGEGCDRTSPLRPSYLVLILQNGQNIFTS